MNTIAPSLGSDEACVAQNSEVLRNGTLRYLQTCRKGTHTEGPLGEKLKENQQVIIQVISLGAPNQTPESPPEKQSDLASAGVAFPDWCNVYEGLSDEEISDIETVVLDRSGWTRDPQ